jgi:hypothetical protein
MSQKKEAFVFIIEAHSSNSVVKEIFLEISTENDRYVPISRQQNSIENSNITTANRIFENVVECK